uniref:ABC transporter ATP-binding protein n=1 Tax=Desulfatirhabdium butyrativorans TaxID=340467 RepID=A0A7C4RPI2_9BACT
MEAAMIRADRLSFRYPNQSIEALSDIHFSVRQGEILLISGPTGCGKSTLAMALCGAIPHLIAGELSGSVMINEISSFDRPVHETARDLGMLLQDVTDQAFTDRVSDEIAFGLENFCIPQDQIERRISDALELVSACHLQLRSLSTLSSGERQRIMLAALLALDQPALVLDEPLAYLDTHSRHRLLDLLCRLAKRGKAILVFEHRRDIVLCTGCSELYLDHGRPTDPPAPRPIFQIHPSSAGAPRLILEDVTFRWDADTPPLFSKLSLLVRAGESTVLKGENGSGKTTLLLMAMGLIRPDKGRILTCGIEVNPRSRAEVLKKAALVLQHPDHQLFLPTVLEEVCMQGIGADSCAAELENMGLKGLQQRHPRSLSMGQKRRLTIASALAKRPELILLDEPSVGQDDHSLSLILKRLDQFVQDGGALLVTTHDERVSRALGHQILQLSHGNILIERQSM